MRAFVWCLVSLVIAFYTWAETCCSKTLQHKRTVISGCYPYFYYSSSHSSFSVLNCWHCISSVAPLEWSWKGGGGWCALIKPAQLAIRPQQSQRPAWDWTQAPAMRFSYWRYSPLLWNSRVHCRFRNSSLRNSSWSQEFSVSILVSVGHNILW